VSASGIDLDPPSNRSDCADTRGLEATASGSARRHNPSVGIVRRLMRQRRAAAFRVAEGIDAGPVDVVGCGTYSLDDYVHLRIRYDTTI
jgi:hypothetical protein